jgi:hypothetical protein
MSAIENGRLLVFVAALLLTPAAVPGCKNAGRADPGASAGTQASAGRQDEFFAKYSAMTATERIQAAMKICYVGRDCDGTEARALVEAAATPTEREALKATARSSFVRQYTALLTEQGKRPDGMTGGEDSNRTLRMTGDACSRFLLENFGSGPGKIAKLIGFSRFECESKALRAGIDL